MAGADEGQEPGGQGPGGGGFGMEGAGVINVNIEIGIDLGISACQSTLKSMKKYAYVEAPDEEPELPPLVVNTGKIAISDDVTNDRHSDRTELVRFEVSRAKQNLCDDRDWVLHNKKPIRVHKRDTHAWLYTGDYHEPNCPVPGPREEHWDVVTYRQRPTAEEVYKYNTMEGQTNPKEYFYRIPPPEEKARIADEFWTKRLDAYAEHEKRLQLQQEVKEGAGQNPEAPTPPPPLPKSSKRRRGGRKHKRKPQPQDQGPNATINPKTSAPSSTSAAPSVPAPDGAHPTARRRKVRKSRRQASANTQLNKE